MTNNAKNFSCEMLLYPKDEKYSESIRKFQGCPTLAITPKGRIFLGWYSGGTREPHMENYNILIYSDDLGKSWSEPVLIIPSNKQLCIHALDIQLWISPLGKLHVFWVQNNTRISTGEVAEPGLKSWVSVDGYDFCDFDHAEWVSVCDNPDAEKLEFSAPHYLDKGFLRCKPTVLKSGRWLNFNYDQNSDRYGYSISDDNGKTYERHYGAERIPTPFDEPMAYEKLDGSVRMFARTACGKTAESTSHDGGITWEPAKLNDINNPNTRFYVSRTPSGRIFMIINDDPKIRKNMTAMLSDDDGKTFPYKICFDKRPDISYPDADFYDGRIYVAYDRGRNTDSEILFTSFTEDDIINGTIPTPVIVSKPKK